MKITFSFVCVDVITQNVSKVFNVPFTRALDFLLSTKHMRKLLLNYVLICHTIVI